MIYVVLRRSDDGGERPVRPFCVTVSPAEAQDYLDGDELVDAAVATVVPEGPAERVVDRLSGVVLDLEGEERDLRAKTTAHLRAGNRELAVITLGRAAERFKEYPGVYAALGQVWLVLTPLLMACVYFMLVMVIRGGSRGVEFFAHLTAALFLFQLFAADKIGLRAMLGGAIRQCSSTSASSASRIMPH